MRIAVISDTHGDIKECISVLKDVEDLSLIMHLGDYSKDAKYIKEELGIDLVYVKGNCDFKDFSASDEELITINSKRILLTHGHKYGVKTGLNKIYYRAKEVNADIVLFGHSHIPLSTFEDNILFVNPGSISSPKGGYKKSYCLLDIDENIKCNIIYV